MTRALSGRPNSPGSVVVDTVPARCDGTFVATLRMGWSGGCPIHAGACAICGAASYDWANFSEAVLWLEVHLAIEHRAGSPEFPWPKPRPATSAMSRTRFHSPSY